MGKMKRAKSASSHGAVLQSERSWASTVIQGECVCVCLSADREADTERCCIAQRPASVSRVVTTVETPRNTVRQREEGDWEKYIDAVQTEWKQRLWLVLHVIYHLATQDGESWIVFWCLSFVPIGDKSWKSATATPSLFSTWVAFFVLELCSTVSSLFE